MVKDIIQRMEIGGAGREVAVPNEIDDDKKGGSNDKDDGITVLIPEFVEFNEHFTRKQHYYILQQ